MTAVGDHWENVYATKRSTEVSWYQRSPSVSLQLIESAAPRDAAVIDVGGGASVLIESLREDGFTDLTILDVSEHALDEVRDRLGDNASAVSFIRHDVLTWSPSRHYDVWHDRAVFHFLTEQGDRERYVDIAHRSLRDGGIAIVGTFAEDGPAQCSGLPVCRYSPGSLDTAFATGFTPVEHRREQHVTPSDAVQPFTWAVFRRSDIGGVR